MKLFLTYLKSKWKLCAVFVLFVLIFLVSFLLYHLPLQAVIYPVCICLLFAAFFLVMDYLHVRHHHKTLSQLMKTSVDVLDMLPKTGDVLCQDYQRIIQKIQEETRSIQAEGNIRYQDMIDYYTVWAHQIKTPIASMKLNLQKEDTELARKLHSDLFRIEQYVSMVLAFLRLDSEFSDYVFREHEVDELIKSAVRKFAGEFINRKIRLVYEPVEKKIVTDDKWFSFVLEQILSNALKYTREGSIRIYMKENELLCISDTGIGIAPQDLPRIFEKGYTGNNGRLDQSASGLGLYLCKRICSNLGINIFARSCPARGTTILIDLKQYQGKIE